MILLIDNYDSFSYNLYQLIGSMNPNIEVARNDAVSVEDIQKMRPSHIVLSPGPGHPEDAGICIDAIRELAGEVPLLGICLGHQAICAAFGATVTYAKKLMHGKQSAVSLDPKCSLFTGLARTIPAARYHSLAVDTDTLPRELKVIARADDGEIMGIAHTNRTLYGLQFHPESILTPDGITILANFMEMST